MTSFARAPKVVIFIFLFGYTSHHLYFGFTETEIVSFWRNLHHWRYRNWSKWQLSVQAVTEISPKLHFFSMLLIVHVQNNVIFDQIIIASNNIETLFQLYNAFVIIALSDRWWEYSQITKFMGPTWGPPGSCRPQMGPCWPLEPCYQGYV